MCLSSKNASSIMISEWTAPGWRAYDLAQVKIRKRQSGDAERQKQKLWDALMKGYRSVRNFTDADEQAVDLFIIARRFWVMGLDVAFIDSDMGALDYGEDWLNDFWRSFAGWNCVANHMLIKLKVLKRRLCGFTHIIVFNLFVGAGYD